ncbi:hypothetical protein N9887_03405, partial [Flavobacteriaceae bacterium]|nr:hypothetical protein [Flavobacteriaceae bacterium]
KDETISTPQKKGQIKVEIKESIDNVDLKNQVEKNLSKIKQIFEIAPPKSMRKSSGKGTENGPINLEDIQIKTEAYNSIENENGKVSYTFEVDFPSDSTNAQEIINLHTYYDENNQLKSQLIKYELTNEELLVATNNQSFDGFWDKISYLDLETTDIDSNSKKNTSARSGDPCSCEDDGPTTVIWVPYSNNSGYGGPSASGVGYALPPLNSLPPNVMAALQAAGVFVGINYNNFAPYGYGNNYTIPVQYFSTNDLTIPAYNPSSSATPFNNYYAYYFSGIKNVIKDYYEKVYVPQINSYVTSTQTTLVDHIVKQKVIYDFFQFTFTLYAQNSTHFYYLSSNHELTENMFYFLAENNSSNYDYTQAKAFIVNVIAVMMANPDANPLLGADCSSFEYAQPPGALQKGCAVSGFDHTFYVAGISPNGSPYYGDVSISMSIAYFTMPTWMTNGLAANHTAEAVTNAIRLTDIFYFENPDATPSQVQNSFNTNLTQQLGIYGGAISGVEPFPIPSPAPYLTSFFGAKTDCN